MSMYKLEFLEKNGKVYSVNVRAVVDTLSRNERDTMQLDSDTKVVFRGIAKAMYYVAENEDNIYADLFIDFAIENIDNSDEVVSQNYVNWFRNQFSDDITL